MSLIIRTTSFDSLTDPLRVFGSNTITIQVDDADYDLCLWLVHRDKEARKETESATSSEPAIARRCRREGIDSEEIGRLRNEFNQCVAEGSYSRADRTAYLETIRLVPDWTDDWVPLLRWSPKFGAVNPFLFVIPINTLLEVGYVLNMIQRPFRRRRK